MVRQRSGVRIIPAQENNFSTAALLGRVVLVFRNRVQTLGISQTVKGVNRGIRVRGYLPRLLHDIKPHELLVLFILTGLGDRRGKRRAQLLHCRLEAMKAAVAVALRVRSAVHISFLLKKVFFLNKNLQWKMK